MPIGSPLGVTLPSVGVTVGPDWATALNECVQACIDSIEDGVESATGLSITGDVDMGGFALTTVDHVAWENKASVFTTASTLYQRANDLYYNDGSGNQIQLTSGGALNAASLAGIVGDYGGSNPAKVTYVDASSTFAFTQDPTVPATVDVGTIKLRRTGETAPNAITVQAPAALAVAYSITMPAAVPVSTSLLTLSAAGVMATTTTPSTSGADIIHGTRTLMFDADALKPVSGTWTEPGTYIEAAASGTADARCALTLAVGQRLREVRVIAQSANGAASDVTAALIRTDAVSGGAFPPTATTLVTTTNMSGSGTVLRTITLAPTIAALATGQSLAVLIGVANTAGAKRIVRVEVDIDRTSA